MRRTLSSALALALATTLVAQQQPCYAENSGNNFNDRISMGGPNLLLAIQFTPNVSVGVRAIDVFTGERTGTNTIAIWSHDPTTNEPLASLGQGSWSMSRTNGWQGANLASSVSLMSGTTYWLVWGPVNSSQASVDVVMGTAGQPYRGSFDGGQSWNGPYSGNDHHWKFRLYCNARGSFSTSGRGCPAGNGLTPNLQYGGTPAIGQQIDVGLASAPPGLPGLLFVGASNTSYLGVALPFDMGGLGAPGCLLQCSGDAVLPAVIDPAGQASVMVTVPNLRPLIGATVYDQWLVLDSAANALGIAVSDLGTVVLGG